MAPEVSGKCPIDSFLIYDGKGTFGSTSSKLERLIRKAKGHFSAHWDIKKISAFDFQPSKWQPGRTVLVIPGGPSSVLEAEISGRFEELRKFIHQGGAAVMICGASYAAATERTFNNITKQGKMRLFPGKASGPIYPAAKECPLPFIHKVAALSCGDKKIKALLSGGGCYFPDESWKGEVLATYQENKKPAVLTSIHGKGIVVHSMVHLEIEPEKQFFSSFEHSSENFNRYFRWHNWEEIHRELSRDPDSRQWLFQKAIEKILEHPSTAKI